MGLLSFLRAGLGVSEESSKLVAKRRLKQVVLHDRVDVSPQFMRAVRYDVVEAVYKYMDINEQDVQIQLSSDDNRVSLVAYIPIVKIKNAARLQIDSNKRGPVK